MPSFGGFAPFPVRFGGAPKSVTLLERVVESLMAARGTAYTQDRSSAVFVESMAYARAIVFHGYEASRKLKFEIFPGTSTAEGLLPRWERIYQLTPLPTDTEVQRRAAAAAADLAVGQNGTQQPIQDAVQAALGPVFSAYEHVALSEARTFWVGGTTSTATPWYSTLAHVLVRVTIPSAYTLGQFFGAVGKIQRVMDSALPAPTTWDWYLASSHGGRGFFLDEPDLDLEVFDV